MGDYNDPFNRNNPAVQSRTKAQNRANVLQLKLIGQSHPTGLTANLLKLFEPRPPLEYKPPIEKRKCPPYTGMGQYVSQFAEPGDPEYAPPVVKAETPSEKRARIRKLRLEEGARKAAEELEKFDPSKDPNVTGDPYKTLFVARLNYETTEHRIKREFETYGPIKRVRLITDKKINKPRGYGFIEYMHTRDMKTAYKQADGRKLDGRRVLVDVERGRTVPNWRPRRLGGGLGSTRMGGEDVNQKHSGREQQVAAGHSRSEEPRTRDDRHHEREGEKSRERGRDRERERERSPPLRAQRTRDPDPRDERHNYRDRDRNRERDRGDREKERDRGRDRDRERDRGRGREKERDRGHEYERERERERDRDRTRDRGRGREREQDERDRGYSIEKDSEYGHNESKQGKDRSETKERDLEHVEHDYGQGWYGERSKHGHGHDYDQYDQSQQYEHYDHAHSQGAAGSEHERERSKHHDDDYYNRAPYDKVQSNDSNHQYGYADYEAREEGEAVGDDYGYHRSERSLSREYEG